jgi:hypothetical protein
LNSVINSFISIPVAWAITPSFFWIGTALMGVPILIHILNRRRYRVVAWAAMEYLLAALRKNRRRLKFEQLLLLITRCAILVMLGLALARPMGCAESSIAAMAGGRTGLHVFVIDNSYTMGYEADRLKARTHLDQAKLLARQQIDQFTAGGESAIVISAARTRGATGTASKRAEPSEANIIVRSTYDLDAAKGAIDRLEQSYGGTDMANALQLAVRLAREETRQPVKHLYVLTDFTRSAWETRDAEMLKQVGREMTLVFGPHVRVHDLGKPGQWNYAVLDLQPEGKLVTTKFHTDFLAEIKGYGPGPDAMVQWKWDDQLLGDGGRLRPDTTTKAQRQTRANVTEGGQHVLSVTLVDDEKLKVDNTRYRVIEVASELKVLIVEGERSTGMLSGSGAFLDLALAPRREIGPGGTMRSDSYVAPELISDLEINNKVFGDYRAVIMANVSALSTGQADQIQKFVKQGGTLMVFLGEQVNPDAYNTIMLPRGLMPGKLVARKAVAADTKGFTMDFKPQGAIHPILNAFRGEEKSGLDTAQVYTYYQVELDPAAKAEVVLKYLAGDNETNDPAITLQSLGKGRVVLVSTTASPDWTSLPAKPAYPALVHELLSGSVDVGDAWMNLEVGAELVVPAGLRLSSVPTLLDPTKKPVPIEAVTQDGQTFYRSKPLEKPGLYQLSTGAKVMPVAVNVPSDEADVRLLPPDAVKKALGDIDVHLVGDELPPNALAKEDGLDFGWPLMLIVLGLVAAECFMAMRFGHYRRQ